MLIIRRIILTVAAVLAAGLLFVNVYNSVVDAPNWGASIPASIDAARAYFAVSNPGSFYRFISPANQVVTVLALVFVWPLGWRTRILTFAALVVAVGADVMTFGFFYPRNALMFTTLPRPDDATLHTAWSEWSTVNWIRSAVVLINVVIDHVVLAKVSKES